MEKRTMTCINCPMGCQVTISYEKKDGTVNMDTVEVTGNTCPRGKAYAISEVTNPTRTVTGTIGVSNRTGVVVSVKTKTPVPKDKVFDVAGELMTLKAQAPLKIGDVVCANILGTGSDLVVTKNID